MKTFFALSACLALGLALAAPAPTVLTVIAHDSFDLGKELVARFERENNASLRFVKGGDAGQMVNRLVLSRGAPLADAVYGIDNTLLPKALAADLLEPYRSPLAAGVPARFRLDSSSRLTPVDYGYVALNYDRAWFVARKLALPKTLSDLTRPEYRNLLVVQNPATSSPGLAFLLATVGAFGENRYLGFWKALRDNGVKVTNGWTDAYNTEFTRNGGSRPIVVSYASSPAAEVFYSEKRPAASPTANLLLPGSSFLQIEGVGVLKGARQPALARKFVDFMLSRPVQGDFPTRMWVYPVDAGARLDPVFRFAELPSGRAVAPVSQGTLASSERLVDAWTRVVVQGQEPPAR